MTKGNRHCCLGVVEQARWLIICTAYSKVWEQCKSSRRAEQQYCHNIVTTCQLARSKFRLQLRNKQHKRHKSLLEGGGIWKDIKSELLLSNHNKRQNMYCFRRKISNYS